MRATAQKSITQFAVLKKLLRGIRGLFTPAKLVPACDDFGHKHKKKRGLLCHTL